MILRAHIICNNKINGHPEADKYGQGSSAGWLGAGPGRVRSCCARTVIEGKRAYYWFMISKMNASPALIRRSRDR